MGLTQIMLPTGYSAAVEDVVSKTGDLARIEDASGSLAVYWNVVCITFLAQLKYLL